MLFLSIALQLLFAIASRAQQDTKLCPELIRSGFLPTLPDRWTVEFKYTYWEGEDSTTKYYEEGFEAFDAKKKRSGFLFVANGDLTKSYQMVSDYPNKKSYMIHKFKPYYEKDNCIAMNLTSNIPANDELSKGNVPIGPMGNMYLSGTPDSPWLGAREQPAGTITYRDMSVTSYLGCHYHDETKQTFQLLWYYAAEPGTTIRVPLGVMLTISDPTRPQYLYMRYDFVSFDWNEEAVSKLVDDSKVFEIPPLYSCNLDPPGPFPDVHTLNVQTYSIEYITLDPVQSWMKQQVEKYNYYRKYYLEKDNVQANDTLYPLTRVGDYSTGVRYNINRYTGQCHASPLDYGLDSVAMVYDDGVCMRSPEQMFGTSYLKYTYDGVRTYRGMDCNTWTTDSTAADGRLTQRVQWCFATNDSITGSHPTLPVTPIFLALAYNNSQTFVVLNQELFSFTTSEPSLYTYDISECFRSTTDPAYMARHFVMQFPTSLADLVNKDPILFKTSFIRQVRHTANVTENRIVAVTVENSYNIDVTFSLLPPAPIPGAASPKMCPRVAEVGIDEAAQKLRDAVVGGSFAVTMYEPFTNNTVMVGTITANSAYESFYEAPRRTPSVWFIGYSSGAMLGVGLSCSLVGFALGIVIFIYLIVPYYAKKSLA